MTRCPRCWHHRDFCTCHPACTPADVGDRDTVEIRRRCATCGNHLHFVAGVDQSVCTTCDRRACLCGRRLVRGCETFCPGCGTRVVPGSSVAVDVELDELDHLTPADFVAG